MGVPRGETPQVRYEIHPLLQGEEIRVARHDRQAVLARVARLRDDDGVRIQEGPARYSAGCSGPIPVRSGPDCRSVALPGNFSPST